MERAKEDAMERVGQIDMSVMPFGAGNSPTPRAGAPAESAQRWECRAEALAAWLLAEWQREQRKEAA